MIFKIIVLVLATLGFSAFAIDNLHTDFNTSLSLAKTKDWTCLRKLDENRVRLEFLLGEKMATYNPPVAGAVLQRAQLQRWGDTEYLVTLWQEGVHATAVRVFDPSASEGPMVWQKYSVGDAVYATTVEGLTVTINEIQPGTTETKKTTVNWKADK